MMLSSNSPVIGAVQAAVKFMKMFLEQGSKYSHVDVCECLPFWQRHGVLVVHEAVLSVAVLKYSPFLPP